MVSFSDRIKGKAIEIGFSNVGIARAESLTTEGARLTEWLERGFHGEMVWLEREPEKRSGIRIRALFMFGGSY